MTPLRIYIGYDSQETVAYHVLSQSILDRTSKPVSIVPLVQSTLKACGLYTRDRTSTESTEFSLTRFLVPYLSHYEGMSLFLDCDMLCQGDIAELFSLADGPVSVAQHKYVPIQAVKFLGHLQTKYACKNWSSVMLFDNAHCKRLTPAYVNTVHGLMLHQFRWSPSVGSLPLEWNWLVGEYDKNDQAKLLHFTQGGPWFRDYQFCDHAQLWFDELDKAFPTLNMPKPMGV